MVAIAEDVLGSAEHVLGLFWGSCPEELSCFRPLGQSTKSSQHPLLCTPPPFEVHYELHGHVALTIVHFDIRHVSANKMSIPTVCRLEVESRCGS